MFEEMDYENLLAVDGGIDLGKIFVGVCGVVGGVVAVVGSPATGPAAGLVVGAGCVATAWGAYKIVDGITE